MATRTVHQHIGKTFGRLTVESVKYAPKAIFVCKCLCGIVKEIRASRVLEGTAQSCGCLRRTDREGQRFGRLVVLEPAGVDQNQHALWKCLCDCGKIIITIGGSLVSGNTASCGCYRSDLLKAKRKPNRSVDTSPYFVVEIVERQSQVGKRQRRVDPVVRTKEYRTWQNIQQRCHNSNNPSYSDYGGRGIIVCSEWRGPTGFDCFLADVGKAPTTKHSLDRIDTNKGYEPGNCRWATATEQSRNRRSVPLYTFDGQTKTLIEWAETLDMNYNTLDTRIRVRNMSFEQAIKIKTTPFRSQRKQKEYTAWLQIKQRCHNQNHHQYRNYGGRGIVVASEWKCSFAKFLQDVGLAPSSDHSIDRIDVNGNYEPGNVRWATAKEQANNRRPAKKRVAA